MCTMHQDIRNDTAFLPVIASKAFSVCIDKVLFHLSSQQNYVIAGFGKFLHPYHFACLSVSQSHLCSAVNHVLKAQESLRYSCN